MALVLAAIAGTHAAADADHRCKVEWRPYIDTVKALNREDLARGNLLFQDFDDWSIYDCATTGLSERTIHQIEDMSRASADLMKEAMWPDGDILNSPLCRISTGDIQGVAFIAVLLPGHSDLRMTEEQCIARLQNDDGRR